MLKRSSRTLQAGCFTCHGGQAAWTARNAQAVAARHAKATGHPTWCDIVLVVRYGQHVPSAEQLDLEAAIAAVPA